MVFPLRKKAKQVGKYFSSGHGNVNSNNSGVCSTAAAQAAWGAVAYDGPTTTPPPLLDLVQQMCWLVTGSAVIIDPTKSTQYAMEKVNFNFHTEATQRSVPNFVNTMGPIV